MKAEKAWAIYYFIFEEENRGTVIRALTLDEMLRLAKLTSEASSDSRMSCQMQKRPLWP